MSELLYQSDATFLESPASLISDTLINWVTCDLREIIEKIDQGWSPQCEKESAISSQDWAVIKTTAIQALYFSSNENKKLPLNLVPKLELEICSKDILITRAGPRSRVAICCLVNAVRPRLILCDKAYRLRANEQLTDPKYLVYFLNSPQSIALLDTLKTGISESGVNLTQRKLLSFEILLAPLPEQKRVAAKLDTVLARVDACRERLNRVPHILKRFRQSVLAAATSGKLTEDWRVINSEGWQTLRADEVCAKVQSGGTPKSGFIDAAGVPFLKVYNIVNQKIDFQYRPQFVSDTINSRELAKSRTLPGDVVMNIVGPPLGKVAVIPDIYPEWNINQAITLFRPSKHIISEWIYIILCGGENISNILNETKGSVGQVNISLSQCRAFEFPVPSIGEQHEIVRRVEILFAFADRLEARLATARTATDRLTPALLAKAFRGELVPQDPNDEPAAELLKRLAAQRAASSGKPRRIPTEGVGKHRALRS